MRSYQIFLAILSLILVTGCRARESNSDVKIVHGVDVPENEYPSVVLLHSSTGKPACTGTFISPFAILTAAHCISYGNVPFYLSGRPDFALSLPFVNVGRDDLMVMIFSKAVALDISKISLTDPAAGAKLETVGYGCTDNQSTQVGVGKKRKGTNTLLTSNAGLLEFKRDASNDSPAGENIGTCYGDSGGPTYVNGEIVGVTSGGALTPGGSDTSILSGLTTEKARKLFAQANLFGASIAAVPAAEKIDLSGITLRDLRSYADSRKLLKTRLELARQKITSRLSLAPQEIQKRQLRFWVKKKKPLEAQIAEIESEFQSRLCLKPDLSDFDYTCSVASEFAEEIYKTGTAYLDLTWNDPDKVKAVLATLHYPVALWGSIEAVGSPPDAYALSEKLEFHIHAVYWDGLYEVY